MMSLILRRFVASALLLGLFAAGAAADEPGEKSLDKQIADSLKDVHNRAADLFNNGDTAGCYRMLQAALLVVKPLLSTHPDVQQAIDAGLASAETQPKLAQRAFALHELVEDVRGKLRTKQPAVAKQPPMSTPLDEKKAALKKLLDAPPAGKEKIPPPPPLWEALGGQAKVEKIVDDWVALVSNNPKANFTRGGKFNPKPEDIVMIKKVVVAFLSQLTGGPLKYDGKTMKEAHSGMHITNAEFNAALVDLRKALEGQGIMPAEAQDLLKLVEQTRSEIVEVKVDVKPPTKKEL